MDNKLVKLSWLTIHVLSCMTLPTSKMKLSSFQIPFSVFFSADMIDIIPLYQMQKYQ